jgi:1-acyl-sn-glycerol-3-phosphate acyltransferase
VPVAADTKLIVRLGYGIYTWLALTLVMIPVFLGLCLVPRLQRRRAVARWGARAVFRLVGSPVALVGEPLPDAKASVIVANHSSYLDGPILTAVLPPEFTFVIKHEMTRVPIAGFVLARLGSEFVDRDSAPTRHRSARRLLASVLRGRPIAVFPEGTFDEVPGLKPFHLGAFSAAYKAGLKVVPIVIHGARAKFPSGAFFVRPGPLEVEILAPLPAQAFGSASELVEATRAAILERLGEPDLEPPAAMTASNPAPEPT